MMEYNANPNEDIYIRLQLAKDETGLYPQTKIYAIDAPTTLVDTLNLVEIANGLYGKIWTNNGQRKKYFTQTIVYTDAGYTTVHPLIRPDSDSINIGFNNTGGAYLGGRGTAVHRVGLTDDEIRAIVKALLNVLEPLFARLNDQLSGVSRFDAARDKVFTDIQFPQIDLPKVPTVLDIANASRVVVREELANMMMKDHKEVDLTGVLELLNGLKLAQKDYTQDFIHLGDKIRQVVEKNKVEIPAQIDLTPELTKLGDSITELKAKDKKEEFLKLIQLEEDPVQIYKYWKTLLEEDKKKVFNYLAKNKPELLKKLVEVAEAEKGMQILANSTDKNTMFEFMYRTGKIRKSMLPIFEKLKYV